MIVSTIKEYAAQKISEFIPQYEKLEVDAIVNDDSYSIVFYATINGKRLQCYQLADMGIVSEKIVDAAFEDIAKFIRASDEYNTAQLNEYDFEIAR